jgi:hypothetical protein
LQELAAGDSAIGESPQLQAALLRGLTAEELWQRAVAGARDRNRQAPTARPQPEAVPNERRWSASEARAPPGAAGYPASFASRRYPLSCLCSDNCCANGLMMDSGHRGAGTSCLGS